MKTIKRLIRILTISSLLVPAAVGQILAGNFDQWGVSVEVISDQRGVLAKYGTGNDRYEQRSYVAAQNDERYRIRVHNRSDERIGLVIAVDGRNIISGDKSHLGPRERMYILSPYQTGEYEGWRTGRDRVNRFYFTGMSDSYAAAWGDYTAMGVIAVAAYNERQQKLKIPRKFDKKSPMNGPMTRGRGVDPGTGFGESERSPSREVEFRPEDRAFSREFIKYEWTSTLCKRGILSCNERNDRGRGNRFWPDDSRERGYAPYPPFWPFR